MLKNFIILNFRVNFQIEKNLNLFLKTEYYLLFMKIHLLRKRMELYDKSAVVES